MTASSDKDRGKYDIHAKCRNHLAGEYILMKNDLPERLFQSVVNSAQSFFNGFCPGKSTPYGIRITVTQVESFEFEYSTVSPSEMINEKSR